MKLLKKLKNKPFANDFHFFLIACLLLLFCIINWIFIIALVLYLLFIYKKTKYLFPIFILIVMIVLRISMFNLIKLDSNTKYSSYICECDDNSYVILTNGVKVKVTDYNHNYSAGDIIEISFQINEFEMKSYDADFDMKSYYYSKGIKYIASKISSNKKNTIFSLTGIKDMIINNLQLQLSENSFKYVKAIVFAENDFESDLKEGYSVLGISHILAISGMHIMLLFSVLKSFLYKVFRYYRDTIPLIIISIYVLLIGAPPSCLRALLFLALATLNDRSSIKYTKLDILSISFIFMILINPYQINSKGFILSFLVSFILLYVKDFIKDSSFLIKSYKSYVLIFFTTLPIVIGITNEISLFSIILSPILSIIVSYTVIPISFIVTIIPYLDNIFCHFYIFLDEYILGISNRAITIPIMSFNIYMIIVYYALLIVFSIFYLKKKRIFIPLLTFVVYIVLLVNIKIYVPYTTVTFCDVGQGDSAVIELKNNEGVIVVDAFGSYNYLKSRGLSVIDYLILSHSDIDHYKDLDKILNRFKVKNILVPLYDEEFASILMGYEYQNVKSGMNFKVSDASFEILGPINMLNDKNSNSLVLRATICNISFLFCGDMTIEEEETLIDKYGNNLKSDVLKVGHHGSNTSSSIEFLQNVRPSYSIISVGKNNSYNLPDDKIVERLNRISTVYITKNTGNITYYVTNDKIWINNYR